VIENAQREGGITMYPCKLHKYAFLMILLIISIILSGCGNSDDPAPAPSENTSGTSTGSGSRPNTPRVLTPQAVGTAVQTDEYASIDTSNLSEGYMGENFLLESLGKGESTDIDMEVYVDGDSMDNSYQETEGIIQFTFRVAHDDAANQSEPDTNKNQGNTNNNNSNNNNNGNTNGGSGTNQTTNKVKTGDNTPILLFAGMMGACLCVVIFIAAGHKRKGKGEESK